jgi:hypothetical protein
MKPSPSKTTKATGEKKRAREEAAGSAAGTSPPECPPQPDPNREWKKSKEKTEDLLALLNSGFLQEKEVDMWRAAAGDPCPMEKNPDEIPMFARFAERGLSLPVSDFFKGLLGYYGIEYLNLNLLTPKLGTGRSLICGPSLVQKSVREKEGFFRWIRQRGSRSAVCFRSARGLFALILRDCVMTWPEQKG